jgi:hypothetical protein
VIFLNESGAALIEYDGKAESMTGRCLEYFEIRKDGEKTFLDTVCGILLLSKHMRKLASGRNLVLFLD